MHSMLWIISFMFVPNVFGYPSLKLSDKLFTKKVGPSYFVDKPFLAKKEELNLSSPCKQHFLEFVEVLQQYIPDDVLNAPSWVLQMTDSWGKVPEGILSGHITALGDFEECVSVKRSAYKGMYCTNLLLPQKASSDSSKKFSAIITMEPSSQLNNLTAHSGVVYDLFELLEALIKSQSSIYPSVASCLPSSCSLQDAQTIASLSLPDFPFFSNLSPVTTHCTTSDKPAPSASFYVMLCVLVLLAVCCFICSGVDLMYRYRFLSRFYNTKWYYVMMAFSIPRNTEKLFSTEIPPSSISCLNGLRFLSAFWVVLGHTFYMHILQNVWNLVDLAKTPNEDLLSLLIVNGGVVVDTFLTISGTLVSFMLLKTLDKSGGKLNIPLIYFSRYIRLTPMYAVLIGISATIMPYLGSGPKWVVVETWAKYCQKNWWHNLLYINNLDIYDTENSTSTNKQCFGEAWYLATDMQLFLISPILIYLLWRWRRVGVISLVILSMTSFVLRGWITYAENLLPTSLPFRARGKFTQRSYMVPWMRASPYLMGLLAGYCLYHTRQGFKMRRSLAVAIWLLTLSAGFSVILGIQKYFDWRYEIPRMEGAFYSAFYHGVWGITVAWIIFACARGYGGWIQKFLSWRVFVPLARLSYAIYLVSLNLQFIFHLSYKQPIYYDAYHAVNLGFAHTVMSIMVGGILHVSVEAPFMQILKLLMLKHTQGTENQGSSHTPGGADVLREASQASNPPKPNRSSYSKKL